LSFLCLIVAIFLFYRKYFKQVFLILDSLEKSYYEGYYTIDKTNISFIFMIKYKRALVLKRGCDE